MKWLKYFFRPKSITDELLGTWETDNLHHFKVDIGYTLMFQTDGSGTYTILDKVNSDLLFTEVPIQWKRLDSNRIWIAKADGSDQKEFDYQIETAPEHQFYDNVLMESDRTAIGFWIIDQALYKQLK